MITRSQHASTESVRQVVYVSQACEQKDESGLQLLLEQSRQFNDRMGVTGVLICGEHFFAQCIEGHSPVIASLYASIEQDTRHRDIIKMVDLACPARAFADWSMAVTWKADHDVLRHETNLWKERKEQGSMFRTQTVGWATMLSMWRTYATDDTVTPFVMQKSAAKRR